MHKRVRVKVHTHMPICSEVWTAVWTKLRKHLVSYMYKCLHVTFCSSLSKQNFGTLTFFVEDIYILLIILCHFAGSVSATANTNCPYHGPYVKPHLDTFVKDTFRLKLN